MFLSTGIVEKCGWGWSVQWISLQDGGQNLAEEDYKWPRNIFFFHFSIMGKDLPPTELIYAFMWYQGIRKNSDRTTLKARRLELHAKTNWVYATSSKILSAICLRFLW